MFKPVPKYTEFVKCESDILNWWYGEGIVNKYLHRNDNGKKRFSFLDGPITANNPMGVHHAWGRTYKDLWQRFYNMRGYKQRFQNGFDCQGLWVEVEVEKELGIKSKKEIENLIPGNRRASIVKFVDLCKKRVRRFSKIQTQQSKRLGYFMDWKNSYFTMSDENNYMIWHFLKTCHKRGWIYKGKDSVPWCPRCETAISQHEMLTEDYKELTHESVFIKFPIINKGWENTSLLVWTTTPWTVPANVAVAVNKKLKYSIYKNQKKDERIIIVSPIEAEKAGNINLSTRLGLAAKEGTALAKQGWIVEKTLLGSKVLSLKLRYRGPFDHLPRVQEARKENPETFHTLIDGTEIVTADEGTGLLHLAPGAGQEDFKLGRKENLAILAVIADDASYLDGMGDFSGKNAKMDPQLILDYLKNKEKGRYFLKTESISHRYPVCWRCKTELVWKVTKEWYIAMDKPIKSKIQNSRPPARQAKFKVNNNKTLRQMMIDVVKKINWIPKFGFDREMDWLTNMDDWLISKKNRYWGLALPIWECEQCDAFDVIGGKEELRKKTVSGWEKFEGKSPHKPQIDDIKLKCKKCGGIASRIEPVGNPWLDAGIVAYSTITNKNQGEPLYLKNRSEWKKWFPADFITESFPGQFKNWFYSLIAMSTVLENTNPFNTVLGFATLLGEDGRPMHKSWGNAIEFNEGADRIGVDVMRWMYTKHDPERNLLFGYKTASETRRQFHLTLWNVYNFFVTYANINKFKVQPRSRTLHENKFHTGKASSLRGKSSKFKIIEFGVLDKWILSRLYQTITVVTESLDCYDAANASETIENFVNDLSRWYVRRSRGRIGMVLENREDKKACLDTLYTVLVTLSKLLAPFTPFMTEEIYKNLTGKESVHLANWPKVDKTLVRDKRYKTLIKEMELVRKICELAHSERKKHGIKVRQPLQKLQVVNYGKKMEDQLVNLIKDEVNVKKIEWLKGKGELKVVLETKITPILKAEGEARELVRKIQRLRKKAGCDLNEMVTVVAPSWPKEYEEEIMRKTLAKRIIWGKHLDILIKS